MRHVVTASSFGLGTTAGVVLFEDEPVLGVICFLASFALGSWRVVHTTRARTALDTAASDRQDRLVIVLPVLPPEVQKEVVRALTPPPGGRTQPQDGGPSRP